MGGRNGKGVYGVADADLEGLGQMTAHILLAGPHRQRLDGDLGRGSAVGDQQVGKGIVAKAFLRTPLASAEPVAFGVMHAGLGVGRAVGCPGQDMADFLGIGGHG